MLWIMPQSSPSKIQQPRMVVLILLQASGEMEVLPKLIQYFLLGKLCHSLKTPKGEENRVRSRKASKTRKAGPGWKSRVSLSHRNLLLNRTGFSVCEKGWHTEFLFIFMLSHKHTLGTCILIQDVVFILGINQ